MIRGRAQCSVAQAEGRKCHRTCRKCLSSRCIMVARSMVLPAVLQGGMEYVTPVCVRSGRGLKRQGCTGGLPHR